MSLAGSKALAPKELQEELISKLNTKLNCCLKITITAVLLLIPLFSPKDNRRFSFLDINANGSIRES
jgi:hypothetical protein